MIAILSEKEDKKIAISIIQKLESKGFKCKIYADASGIDQQNSEQIELGILVFSAKSNSSEKMMKDYEYFFENEIPVIPFVISDLELSVSMQYFLNSHDWVNAFDISTNKAINDLVLLVEENLGESPNPESDKKTEVNQVEQNPSEKSKKNQTIAVLAISVIFLIIIGYFIFGNKSNTPFHTTENPENFIVGNWKLAKYEDNMTRNNTEYADFISEVTVLKKNFLLKINKDNTFEKYGFAQPENGNWQFDAQNKVLYMWPPGSKHKDMLAVEKLTADSLIMSIATQIDSVRQVITKLSLYKE